MINQLPADKALEILNGLIAKPETAAADIPTIWSNILAVYAANYTPVVVEEPVAVKKTRKPRDPGTVIGWPAGVKRDEFKAWKDARIAEGATTGISPQDYKNQRDAAPVVEQPQVTVSVTVAEDPAPELTNTAEIVVEPTKATKKKTTPKVEQPTLELV